MRATTEIMTTRRLDATHRGRIDDRVRVGPIEYGAQQCRRLVGKMTDAYLAVWGPGFMVNVRPLVMLSSGEVRAENRKMERDVVDGTWLLTAPDLVDFSKGERGARRFFLSNKERAKTFLLFMGDSSS